MFVQDDSGKWHAAATFIGRDPDNRQRAARADCYCRAKITNAKLHEHLPDGEFLCAKCSAVSDKKFGVYPGVRVPIPRVTAPRPVKPLEGQRELFGT